MTVSSTDLVGVEGLRADIEGDLRDALGALAADVTALVRESGGDQAHLERLIGQRLQWGAEDLAARLAAGMEEALWTVASGSIASVLLATSDPGGPEAGPPPTRYPKPRPQRPPRPPAGRRRG
jgi:hypothetical protein